MVLFSSPGTYDPSSGVYVCVCVYVCACVCVHVFVYVHPMTQEFSSHPKCPYCQSSQGIPHFINDNG